MKTGQNPAGKQKRINIDAKSGLARLMAIENLAVLHNPKASTASFDLKDRVLTLPVLKDMSGPIFDWFIGHEVSHALNTPADQYIKLAKKYHPTIANIVEDARIEKLIIRRYPGLKRDNFLFYKEFASPERDFFGLKELTVPVDKLSLVDRLNLHFKIGPFHKINFSQEEMKYVDMLDKLETFEDVEEATKALYKYMKDRGELEEIKIKIKTNSKGQGEEQDQNDSDDGDDDFDGTTIEIDMTDDEESGSDEDEKEGENGSEGKDGDKEGSDGEDESEKSSGSGKGEDKDGDDKKDQSQKSKGKGKADKNEGEDGEDGQQPSDGKSGDKKPTQQKASKSEDKKSEGDGKQQTITIKMGQTQTSFDKNIQTIFEKSNPGLTFGEVYNASDIYKKTVVSIEKIEANCDRHISVTEMQKAEATYAEFLREINPTVNMMVAQFNLKKSAKDYQKMQISKTGRLDMDKISDYKISNDLFLRNEVIPESKNHGMVMFIDWSGSMSTQIGSTVKQLIILMEFCRKVQIPFEVYGFTDSAYTNSVSIPDSKIFASQGGNLFQMFSSGMKINHFRKMAKQVLHLATTNSASYIYSMGGTPLLNAMFLAEYAVNEFKVRYKCEKTAFVLLSDGGATDRINCGSTPAFQDIIMRNAYNGKNYQFKFDQQSFHYVMQYVRERCNIDSTVGFFLTNSCSSGTIDLLGPEFDKSKSSTLVREFDAKKFTVINDGPGFDKFFAIAINNFKIDKTDYLASIDSRTSKNALDAAFTKQLARASSSMVFMKAFIDQIS